MQYTRKNGQPFRASHLHVPTNGKLTQPLRIAFISDLHAEQYGQGQCELLDAVRAFRADLVIFGGDTFDERVS